MKFLFCLLIGLLVAHGPGSAVAAQANGVAGKWHFVLDTEGGDRDVDATLEQSGNQVTGKWGGKDEVKGTFADGKLNLEFPIVSEEAGPGTLKITGQLDGEKLSGNWNFQSYSGTFKATKATRQA